MGTWKVHLSFHPVHKNISGAVKHKKVIITGNDEGWNSFPSVYSALKGEALVQSVLEWGWGKRKGQRETRRRKIFTEGFWKKETLN